MVPFMNPRKRNRAVTVVLAAFHGVVYEKDLGPKTLDAFRAMERDDPDATRIPVEDRQPPLQRTEERIG